MYNVKVCVQVLGTRKLMLVTHEEFEKVHMHL